MRSGRLQFVYRAVKHSVSLLECLKVKQLHFYAVGRDCGSRDSTLSSSQSAFYRRLFGKMSNISDILDDVRANANGHENGNEVVDSSYILIDIGANLTNKKFSRDVDAVVQRANQAGVQKIMVNFILMSHML